MNQSESAGAPGRPQAGDLGEEVKILREEVKYNRERINAIETRMPSFDYPPDQPVPRRTFSGPVPHTAHTEMTDDTELSNDFQILNADKVIPRVRECTFVEFKNRFEPNGKDGRFAVDVLVSGQLLQQEISEEHSLREKLFKQRGPQLARLVKDKTMAKAVKMANTTTDLISQAQSHAKWVRRIRIQAPALLRILARVNREKWTDRPRTYYRPFNSLIYQHSHIKRTLEALEERWGSVIPASEDSDQAEAEPDEEESVGDADHKPLDEDDDSVEDSPQALACLRAYVKYIDDKLMPEYRQFENKDGTSNSTVRFSDLWYLFRTGELIYQQTDGELPDRRDFRTGKRIWKTYYVDPVPERLLAAATDDTDISDAAVTNDDTAFSLGCYYVDYTGEEFCVVKKTVRIEQFPGEMPVIALPVYPMRFCPDWKDRLKHAKKTGDELLDFIHTRHCSYTGWTLTRSPGGEPTTDQKGVQLQQPEHINSEVMVDFGEAFQACPSWRPHRAGMRQKIPDGLTVPENFRIRWWSGSDRAILLGETTEMIPVRSGVTAKQRNKFINEDPFLVAVSENTKSGKPTLEKDLKEDTKALLTGRVFAYVFQERKFAQLAVAKLRPSPKTGLALDSLKIPQTVKRAIQGSIQGHFMQKNAEQNAERTLDQDWVSLDLIQGKGTGLFILLHGVPGVGKTATAEAIAQAHGKPLFKMTVGDLGMTPENLEISLREIFRLASIWDCILLLDEVDTFFSERSRSDASGTKNALVSVFLRVLDYYNGILFLTTNRAGVLDEAFKSRIHFKIYYPDLSIEQTLDIWKLNIQRVRRIEEKLAVAEKREPLQVDEARLLVFAKQLFLESMKQRRGPRPWNGRQIRNAFQVARSLAYYEYGMGEQQGGPRPSAPGQSGPPTLDVRHFQTMHEITTSFDNYLTSIKGTDASLALHNETRHDNYRDSVTEGYQAEYRADHLRAAATAAGSEATATEGADPSTEDVVTTVAVTNRVQRPRHQQHLSDGDDLSPGENFPSNRHRGNSFNASRNPMGASPPPVNQSGGFDGSQQLHSQAQSRFAGSRGLEPGGAYMLASGASRGGGFPAQMYGSSTRGGSTGNLTAGYRQQQGQYALEAGGMTPRGPSPGVGDGGVLLGGGMGGERRDFSLQQLQQQQQEYYGQGGGGSNSFLPAREGVGMHPRQGSDGWGAGMGGGQGYGNQYSGRERDSLSRQGQGETDLSRDDGPF